MVKAGNIKVKYWASEILSSENQSDLGKIAGSLAISKIDLNPHQIEAAIFALNSPVSRGVILADETGLGKTIESGLIMGELFSKGQSSFLVVSPASLCQQWQTELQEKFNLPTRIINTGFNGNREFKGVTICSYHCAVLIQEKLKKKNWDIVVIDEAHKLRNLYKGGQKIAGGIYEAFSGRKKLLLTATPIQNSLMDIYSLVSVIDQTVFGNPLIFEENYLNTTRRIPELKERLKYILFRTLRKDVLDYVKYTNREAMTVVFSPSAEEENLYKAVMEFIFNISKIAIIPKFRSFLVLTMYKLMSSSTAAVLGTLEKLQNRLLILEQREPSFNEALQKEKSSLQSLIFQAQQIKTDVKTKKLLEALSQGFEKIKLKGGQRKALIFTESNRTLNYLYHYLSQNGFEGKIVTFNGQNNSLLCQNQT